MFELAGQSYTGEHVADMLRGAELRPSTVRIHVLKYLLERRNHPSIDSIYRALLETLPGLSKASVYNSIGALENAGLVRSLALEGCEMRYDAFTADHGHFKCEHCGEVFDIDTEIPQLPAEALDGFLVRQRDLFIRGLCPECRAVIRQ